MSDIFEAQCQMCLEAHRANPQGLANFEVADIVELPETSCYWHRCTDLCDHGYIEPKIGPNGKVEKRFRHQTRKWQQVKVVTEKGMTQNWKAKGKRPARNTDPDTSHEAGL